MKQTALKLEATPKNCKTSSSSSIQDVKYLADSKFPTFFSVSQLLKLTENFEYLFNLPFFEQHLHSDAV